MLDTAEKILEKLIKSRVLVAIQSAGDLSPRHYGFRRWLSTVYGILEVVEVVRGAEDYNHFSRLIVLLVTFDVKNAFNSVKWSDIIQALELFTSQDVYSECCAATWRLALFRTKLRRARGE